MPASKDDPHPNEYTFAEKLAAVNAGVMAPEDLGVLPTPGDASEATAGGVEIKPATPEELAKKPETGDYIVFQAAVVPPDLRSEWARLDAKAENKILPFAFDKEAWKKAHEAEHLIQAKFQCGTASGAIEGKFSDKILGLCNLLDAASKQLREFYANEQKSKTDTTTP
jgi:hypothetical protein